MTATRNKTLDMVYIAIGAVLITICSWISIPTAIPFTMQTFAVFLTIGLLGGKRGTLSVIVYLLLGAAGIPVFSGFTSGIGIMLGTTGGYMVGFLLTGLIMWGMERIPGNKTVVLAASMVLGLLVCYLFGTIWFQAVYARDAGAVGLAAVLGWCVFPFILPDLIKIVLAVTLVRRISPYVS